MAFGRPATLKSLSHRVDELTGMVRAQQREAIGRAQKLAEERASLEKLFDEYRVLADRNRDQVDRNEVQVRKLDEQLDRLSNEYERTMKELSTTYRILNNDVLEHGHLRLSVEKVYQEIRGMRGNPLYDENIGYGRLADKLASVYADMTPLGRLRVSDTATLVSYAGCVVCFVYWAFTLPPLRSVAALFIPNAYAAPDGSPVAAGPMQYAIFGVLLALLVVSLFVQYFGKGRGGDVNAAGTYAKMLFGFFIGAATKYIPGMA